MVEQNGSFFVGLDLGQARDPSAISVVERLSVPTDEIERDATTNDLVQRRQRIYRLRHLMRPQLGTSYVSIVETVVGMMRKPEIVGARLVVDFTGVGAAVTDMLHKAGLDPVAVYIHGGDKVTERDGGGFNVPKRDLAGVLQMLLQTKRFHIRQSMPLADVFMREMLNFKVKVNISTGHDSYEALREGDHDDLVLCVAIPCWYAERPIPPRGMGQEPLLPF